MQENDFFEKIALYFYFACLDEARAQSAIVRISKKIRKSYLPLKKINAELSASGLVRLTSEFNMKSNKIIKPTSLAFSDGHIVMPKNANWGPWFEFRKLANDKVFNAVLYSKVLGLSEEDIASGLGIPLGTVRYRTGSGLKLLGSICRPGDAHVQS